MSAIFTGSATKSLSNSSLTGTLPGIEDYKLVTAWIKPTFTAGSDLGMGIVDLRGAVGGGRYLYTGMYTGDGGSFDPRTECFTTVDEFGATFWFSQVDNPSSGSWQLVATLSEPNSSGSSNIYAHRDATEGTGGSDTGNTDTADFTRIIVGLDSSAEAPMNGRIADVALWTGANIAALRAIVAALWNSGSPKRADAISGTASPIKYWPLTTNANASVGGNNLTNNGTVTFDSDEPAWSYNILSAPGAYSLAGSATLKADRKAYPAAANYSLASAVSLRADRVLQAAAATINLSGAVDLRADRFVYPAAADFAVAATAEFTYTPVVVGYTLDCAAANFDIAGAARLAVDRYLDLAQADYTVSSGVDLRADRNIQPAAADFAVAGAAGLKADRVLNAAAAQFDIAGSAEFETTQPQHYSLVCEPAEFTLSSGVTLAYAPLVASTRPTGGPPGKRVRFRGRYYDSIKDRQYLSRALQEFVEERVVEQPKPQSRKRRKKAKKAEVARFTPAEVAEIEPIIAVVQEREQKLAEYVAELMLMMEEEEFLLMAA